MRNRRNTVIFKEEDKCRAFFEMSSDDLPPNFV